MKKVGIIGLPLSGKSLVLSLLGCEPLPPGHPSGKEFVPRIVAVPDQRLKKLGEIFQPPKLVPAQLEFLEIPNLKTHEGGWKMDFVRMKELDGFLLVLGNFSRGDLGLPEGEISSGRDLETLETELMLADLEGVSNRLEKVSAEEKRGRKIDPRERALLERCRENLENEVPLRKLSRSEQEERLISGFQFLSQRPAVAVINVSEERINSPGDEKLKDRCRERGLEAIRLSARIELEVSQLDESERKEFLRSFGIEEPARDRLIQAVFQALELISFFTIGEKEIRAWMIERGAPALEAAGKVHTDMKRGFIRAEVINFAEFIAMGSLEEARHQGKLRLEGKTYPVQDGDLIKFRFSV